VEPTLKADPTQNKPEYQLLTSNHNNTSTLSNTTTTHQHFLTTQHFLNWTKTTDIQRPSTTSKEKLQPSRTATSDNLRSKLEYNEFEFHMGRERKTTKYSSFHILPDMLTRLEEIGALISLPLKAHPGKPGLG
jgi:hypothetical protein